MKKSTNVFKEKEKRMSFKTSDTMIPPVTLVKLGVHTNAAYLAGIFRHAG